MHKMLFKDGTPEVVQRANELFGTEIEKAAQPIAHNYSSFGARKVEDSPHGPILEFIAVSEGVKRDGSTIQVKGIDLRHLKANPIWCWAHNYSLPPIGRIVDFRKSSVEGLGKVLKVRVAPLRSQMDTEHKRFADSIFDLYLQGDLRTVSFGWKTVEATPLKDNEGYMTGWDFVRTDAMEVSAVPVPADPDALITSIRERGLDAERFVINRKEGASVYEVREAIPDEFSLDANETELEVDPVEVRETEVETPKVEVATEIPAIDFEAKFTELTKRFGDLEKKLDNLPVAENRKGAVLNAANRKALMDAMQLINAVIKNAGEPTADAGTAAAEPETKTVKDPEVRKEGTKEKDVPFEDVADILTAMRAKREASVAEDILGAMALKAKSRSKGGTS